MWECYRNMYLRIAVQVDVYWPGLSWADVIGAGFGL
jgi:hypothetical protein